MCSRGPSPQTLSVEMTARARAATAALPAALPPAAPPPTKRDSTTLRHCIKFTSMTPGGVNWSSIGKTPPCYCPRHQRCSNMAATGALKLVPRGTHTWRAHSPPMTPPLAARSRKTQSITLLVCFRASSHRQTASTASKIILSVQSRSAVGTQLKASPPRLLSLQHCQWLQSPHLPTKRHPCMKSAALTHRCR